MEAQTKLKLIMLCGIPGSGKSTYINKSPPNKDWKVICPDSIRFELTGNAGDQSKNGEVWKIAYNRVKKSFDENFNVIFDATLVSKKSRKDLIAIGKENGAYITAVYFEPNLELSIKRVGDGGTRTERTLPNDVLVRMNNAFEVPSESEGIDKVIKAN